MHKFMKLGLGFLRRLAGIVLLGAGAIGATQAQDFPAKPIEIYVGFAAGGTSDLIARAVAEFGPKYMGQRIVAVNKPGASGTIASEFVARSKPDGYTLLMGGGSETIAVGHFRQLPFDPIGDFETVICFLRSPAVIDVKGDSRWKTAQDFIADVKANPGKYTYGTSGVGSWLHAVMLVLEKQGLVMKHVPFAGSAESTNALLGGHIDANITSMDEAQSLIEAGMVRQLAQTGDKRLPSAPNVPTMKELGYPVYMENMKGLMAPKGTPKAVIKTLHDGFHKMAQDPAFIASMNKLKLVTGEMNSEEFGKAITAMSQQIGDALKK